MTEWINPESEKFARAIFKTALELADANSTLEACAVVTVLCAHYLAHEMGSTPRDLTDFILEHAHELVGAKARFQPELEKLREKTQEN